MGRFLLAAIAAAALVAGATGCGDSANAAPQGQAKAATPGSAPQKSGGQGMPGGQSGAAAAAAGRTVSTAPVISQQVKLTLTYTGTVQPRMQLNLSPKSSGRIEQLLVDVGSEVKEGDPIAVMERAPILLSVQQADANLKSAQAKLATVMAGGRPEDIASAQAALDSAKAKLDTVKAGASAADLQAAQSAVDAATASLAGAQAKMDAVRQGPTQSDMAAASAAVDSAKATLKSTETKLNQVKAGSTAYDLQSAQYSVQDAMTKLLTAQDDYGNIRDDWAGYGGKKYNSVSAAKQGLDAAQASYDAAVQKLNQLQAGPLPADLQSAQSTYDSAKASLDSATAKLDQLKRTPSLQDLQQAQASIDSVQATLTSAQTKLAQLKAGPSDNDLTVAQAAVTQAEQTLALKQKPYTDQDLLTAQAAVEVAKVSVASANAQLSDATLAAPFAGIITQRPLAPGAVASSSTPVVTLVSQDIEIPVSVEESRLAQLKPGLSASISVAAYPGQTFTGKVASISPSADTRSHSFTMKVVAENRDNKLKAGMLATLQVAAEEHPGLLVPRDAVTQRTGKDVVFVVSDGRARMRQVLKGLPQESNVEILDGVKAGEQVIVVGYGGLNDGDPVRTAPAAGGQQQGEQQGEQQGQMRGQQQGQQGQQQRGPQQGQQQQAPGTPTKQQ